MNERTAVSCFQQWASFLITSPLLLGEWESVNIKIQIDEDFRGLPGLRASYVWISSTAFSTKKKVQICSVSKDREVSSLPNSPCPLWSTPILFLATSCPSFTRHLTATGSRESGWLLLCTLWLPVLPLAWCLSHQAPSRGLPHPPNCALLKETRAVLSSSVLSSVPCMET